MDSTIYKNTIDSYVKRGLPNLADLKIAMLDTNVWTDVAKATRESADYHKYILQQMFKDVQLVVIPEVILRECAGSGKQKNMTDKVFNQLYEPAFQAISAQKDIHVVTFTDMENMMLNSNGGKKDYALREALIIANELFDHNSDVKAALATVQQFHEIEAALTVISDDAGERVLLFFTMLFLNEYWAVDVYTNEVEVYTDRIIIGPKEKLREALGSIMIEEFYETYQINSYDVVLFGVMVEHDSQWSKAIKRDFVTQCRNNKARKIRIQSKVANYSNVEHCDNNNHFLTKYEAWIENSMSITF
ncbi:hypothetical protein ACQKM9_17150 [Viridibacillus sp. NPDC093762]|uniref:hypothetical protein n=1 Tax=Viridibacillus sp. NPDC093762 TaxID=3390720 RepID=UPI003CFD42D8